MNLITATMLACCLASSVAFAADERQAFFGDLHLHTSNSYDAAWAGVRTTREDAYRYARGLPAHYMGHEVRRRVPLDFLAVADHAEYMGVAIRILEDDGPFADTDWPRQMLDADGMPADGFLRILRSAFYGPDRFDELDTPAIRRSSWQDVIAAADAAYEPGRFTTFAAFEWSDTPGGSHFHRVAVFPGPEYPQAAFSALDSRHPEDLWRWADEHRERGIDSVLIPHNPNLSGGRQFAMTDSYGAPADRAWAGIKARNEPLVEVTQIKGTSETHPLLSPDDGFADFEIIEHYLRGELQPPDGSYVRQAWARGLEIAAGTGANPYRFGLIGSSDYHSGTSAVEEDNHTGALGRGDYPFDEENATRVLSAINPVINQPIATLSASGIAGVWAQENTREAVFAALKRREAFATSGPRIRVRLFAGWDYPAEMLEQHDWVARAYAGGVPMGGELKAQGRKGSPRFLVQALKDPDGANLERVQLIKVWVDGDGAHREAIYDVAGPGQPGAALSGEWIDPDFNPALGAVYYARVLEVPTPRWSTFLAERYDLPVPDTVPTSIQERAWTSPIFVDP